MRDRTADIDVNPNLDLVKQLKAEFIKDQEHWQPNYQKAKEDLKFTSDDDDAQWDQTQKTKRTKEGRPALTVDQLSQFIHQVVNDIRMNTPSILVIPAGNEADTETAEIYKGLIRNIEYVSNADDVYDTASLNSVKCSIGYIRVDHDYIDEESFDQQLLIKRMINPLSVFLDRDSIEADGRDAKRGTVIDKITVAQFKKDYPGKNPVCFQALENAPLKDNDYLTIAEMFVIEEEAKTVGLMDDGQMEEMAEGKAYKTTRKVTKKTVKRYKLSGEDILEETTFPGKYVPLVPVYGEESWIEGKRNIYSLIRRSKDAQRLYNFMKSNEIEVLMTQPKAPWMAAEGQIKDKNPWLNPGQSEVLEYATTDLMGNPVPAPQRINPPTISTGFYQAGVQAVDDIKATLGMYNASIGQRSNETSGRAIQARQQEGDVATFHFGDNLSRSITHVGRILVCAIPEIYDAERIVRIIGEEDEPKEIGINGAMTEKQEVSYDLSKGKYDVRVVTGPAFSTRRQETVAALGELFQSQPQLMQVMGDLYFKNSDFSGSAAMASRMEKVIDPKFLDDEAKERMNKEQVVDPEKEQMKQLIQQGMQEFQTVQQELEATKSQLQNKTLETQVKAQESQAKAQLEAMKLQLEAQKLELEQQKIAIDAEKAQTDKFKAQADIELRMAEMAQMQEMPAQPQQPQMPSEIKLNTEGFQFSKTPEALAMEQEQANSQAMLMQQQMAMAAEQEAQELEMRAMQTKAIVDSLAGISQQLAALNKPKSVVYSADGQIMGVK